MNNITIGDAIRKDILALPQRERVQLDMIGVGIESSMDLAAVEALLNKGLLEVYIQPFEEFSSLVSYSESTKATRGVQQPMLVHAVWCQLCDDNLEDSEEVATVE